MSHTTLTSENLAPIVAGLAAENRAFMAIYPGESDRRQAVHTVYGGAHLFKADSTGKLGEVALRSLRDFAPNAAELTRILAADWELPFAEKLYARIVEKLGREPIEDFRLDFEDGYGNRVDSEEDGHAARSAWQHPDRPPWQLPVVRHRASGGRPLPQRPLRGLRLHRVERDHGSLSGDGPSHLRLRAGAHDRVAGWHRRPSIRRRD